MQQNTHAEVTAFETLSLKDVQPETVQHWAGKGFWAVTDQGLFAASNFLLNILMARWLSPQEYGAFAIAFSVFLLLQTAHTTLLTEPMLVFGPGRHRNRFKPYIETLLAEHWKLTALLSLAVLAVGLGFDILGSPSVGTVMFALAPVVPFILLGWLLRRACYVRVEPKRAATAGTIYASLILAGAFLLHRFDLFAVSTVFGLMGVASLTSALWLARGLGLRLVHSAERSLLAEARREHWEYGRWLMGAAGLRWASGNLYFLILPVWGGLGAAGAFRALFNFLLPILHVNMAFGPILVPALVRARGSGAFRRRVRLAVAAFLFGGISYWGLLALLHRPAVGWLYAGRYDTYASILLLLGTISVTTSLVSVVGSILRATERTDRVFWSYVYSGAVALVAALLLIPPLGVLGASLALVLSSITVAVVMTWQVRFRSDGHLGAKHEPLQ